MCILKFCGCSLSLNNVTSFERLLNSNGNMHQGQRKTIKTKLAFIIGLFFIKKKKKFAELFACLASTRNEDCTCNRRKSNTGMIC